MNNIISLKKLVKVVLSNCLELLVYSQTVILKPCVDSELVDHLFIPQLAGDEWLNYAVIHVSFLTT